MVYKYLSFVIFIVFTTTFSVLVAGMFHNTVAGFITCTNKFARLSDKSKPVCTTIIAFKVV